MNRGLREIVARALVATGFVVLGATHAAEPPRWIAELAAESGAVRDGALAALPGRLLDLGAMRLLLEASARDPEIESRGRATGESHPALAPVLAVIARAERAGADSLSRDWLEALIAAEIARRAPLERLVARSGRSTLFTANVVTGLRFPRVDRTGRGIPFDRALAALAAIGEYERPIALDPALDVASLPPVRAEELLPSTSGGLLKRWLVPRELQVVDLGLLHLVTSRDVEERIAAARERDVDANRRRRIEFDSARLLVDRLTSNAPDCDAARVRLWLALDLPGSRLVAAQLGTCGDPAIETLGLLSPELSADEFARRLATVPDDLKRVATGGREFAPHGDLQSAAEPANVRALVAASTGSSRFDHEFVISDDVLVAAIDETALLETLDREAPFHAPRPGASSLRATFARVAELEKRVAAFEAGVAFAERASDLSRLPFDVETARAFLLGACRPDVSPRDDARAREIVALCARLAPRLPELARVCALFVTPSAELAQSAREIARGEELSLRAAISRAAILEAGGDDGFAYALLFELRGANKESRTHSALYDELFAVVSMLDSGPIRWFSILDSELR